MRKGLVHIYTGSSKGKTTAAFGLAVRALGSGMRVLVAQFLKGGGKLSGEAAFLGNTPGAELMVFDDQRHPLFSKKGAFDLQKLVKSINDGFGLVVSKINSGEYDLVILDEINNCMKEGWLEPDRVAGMLKAKPGHVEVVLTGRGAPDEILALADYVTEMRLVKHPAEKGTRARKGIEY